MSSANQAQLLLVDDNDAQRLALAAVLADLDVTVVEAASGRDALRCLLQAEFAVILLDVNMPGLDGFETAALIRQRRSSEHTPIIFVTAYSDDTHAARGYSLGAVDFILAPVEPEVLRTKVAVFIDLYKKSEQLKRQREALQRYAAQLQQLSEASLAINSAQSIEDILAVMADNAERIVGTHQVNISAVLQDGAFTVTRTSDKYGAQHNVQRTARLTSIPEIQQPVRLTATAVDSHPARAGAPRQLVDGIPLRGWLAAPLSGHGRTIGLAQVSDKYEGDFSAEDEGILVQLAQMASVAIENILTKEAREANRLKDEFLSVLSHELRTPLQAMVTWIGILRNDGIDAGMRARGLEVIEAGARAQCQLIDDLLDVSRIIRGQLRLDVAPLDLITVIELAVATLKPAALTKAIWIAWTPPAIECRVVGDASRLQQVVWNLLSNAIRFTPNGGRVELRLTREGELFEIQVRDTGTGIPAAFLPHVFERFRQADSTTTRSQGGLGLGLAIVHHLIELHGGTVHADNIPGGGAVFTVKLPCDDGVTRPVAAALAGADHGNHQAPAAPANGSGRLDGLRVVLVEDDANARDCLAAGLQLLGAQVVPVESAAAALAELERAVPDILLSDIAMGGEDGYALIRQIRARETEGGRRLPAAALTAYVRPEDRHEALSAGFDVHVPKPVQPLELASLIKHLTGRTKAL